MVGTSAHRSGRVVSVSVRHIDHPSGCPCCRQSAGAPTLGKLKTSGVSVRERKWAKRAENALLRANELDTLGQAGTEAAPAAQAAAPPPLGKLGKRARGKYFSQHLALALIDVERRRIEAGENAPLRASRKRKAALTDGKGLLPAYWRTYHCGNEMRNEGGRLVTTLCRSRWCTVCNKIETARLINRYKPVIDTWDEKYLVTLTLPNVPAAQLPATIGRMKSVFRTIREMIKKQYQRGERARPLEALRKLETTYNMRRGDFHPHFHFLTNDLEIANLFVSEWLRHIPEAKRKAQDVRKADENSVLELFKYFAKLTASGGKGQGDIQYIPAEALNIIFNAVAGERVFQAFGLSAAPAADAPEDAELAELALERGERWLWTREANDWVEHTTGECLTGYVPSDALRDLVERRILRTQFRARGAPPAKPLITSPDGT